MLNVTKREIIVTGIIAIFLLSSFTPLVAGDDVKGSIKRDQLIYRKEKQNNSQEEYYQEKISSPPKSSSSKWIEIIDIWTTFMYNEDNTYFLDLNVSYKKELIVEPCTKLKVHVDTTAIDYRESRETYWVGTWFSAIFEGPSFPPIFDGYVYNGWVQIDNTTDSTDKNRFFTICFAPILPGKTLKINFTIVAWMGYPEPENYSVNITCEKWKNLTITVKTKNVKGSDKTTVDEDNPITSKTKIRLIPDMGKGEQRKINLYSKILKENRKTRPFKAFPIIEKISRMMFKSGSASIRRENDNLLRSGLLRDIVKKSSVVKNHSQIFSHGGNLGS